MSELASAYVQIVPSAKGIKGSITKELGGEVAAAGTSAGGLLGGKIVGALTGALAAAGIGKVISDAVAAGADLEQSIGGIETLFGAGGAQSVATYASNVGKSVTEVKKEYADLTAAQERMFAYADEAYKTAGLSANEYMQTVSSFAASLKQSTGDDMEALTTAANQAVIDMADNANRMGTDMQSIQNAYQGFAKQNYTMLDNLKLGYGGTKDEMERLLADAEKISGTKYDIGNLDDVYGAIHVIQEELGYAGTTAKEASQTISGSLASMKAAFSNVLAKITIGDDVTDEMSALVDSVNTFVTGNLLPALGNIAKSLAPALGQLFDKAAPIIKEKVMTLLQSLPQMLKDGGEKMRGFMGEFLDNIIAMLKGDGSGNGASEIGAYLLDLFNIAFENMAANIATIAPKLFEIAGLLIDGLISSIQEYLPNIGTQGSAAITEFMAGLQANLPSLLEQGVQFVTNTINGILQALPQIISTAGELIMAFVNGLLPMLPTLLENGMTLVLNLIDGILTALPDIATAALELVGSLGKSLLDNAPELIATGFELIGMLIGGLISGLYKLGTFVYEFKAQLRDKIKNIDWKKIGMDILNGIIEGLKAGAGALAGAFSSLISGIAKGGDGGDEKKTEDKGKQNGKALVNGMADGVRMNAGALQSALKDASQIGNMDVNASLNANGRILNSGRVNDGGVALLNERINALAAAMETQAAALASGRDVKVVLEGDARALVQRVRKEAATYKLSTGRGMFA